MVRNKAMVSTLTIVMASAFFASNSFMKNVNTVLMPATSKIPSTIQLVAIAYDLSVGRFGVRKYSSVSSSYGGTPHTWSVNRFEACTN